ncbi:MAG TPA: hypothetical protein VKA25_02665 [Gemmatimonadales bacterium]|nr:hypothetical protein [Gemmatimonadales bacterium]
MKATIAVAVIAPVVLAFLPLQAVAATAWIFNGPCKDGSLKRGQPTDDLRAITGETISCNQAILMELKNGRKLIHFNTQNGTPLGFAGTVLDTKTNPKLMIFPLDRIYPVRDLGQRPDDIYQRSRSGEGVLDGAQGFCFFNSHTLNEVTGLSCTAMHQIGDRKVVYRVGIDPAAKPIRKVLPDPE